MAARSIAKAVQGQNRDQGPPQVVNGVTDVARSVTLTLPLISAFCEASVQDWDKAAYDIRMPGARAIKLL